MAKKKKEKIIPIIPEHKPQRTRVKPTIPNKQIPEIVPQKEKEEQNIPPPAVPEHKPQRTRVKPTKPNRQIPEIVPQKKK